MVTTEGDNHHLEEELNSIIDPLNALEHVLNIEHSQKTFKSFLKRFEKSIDETYLEPQSEGEMRAHVLSVEGAPGSGKTWAVEKIREYLEGKYPTLYNNGQIRTLYWEKDGEDAARDAGEIFSPNDQLFSDDEVNASNNRFTKAVINAVNEGGIILVEAPSLATLTSARQLRTYDDHSELGQQTNPRWIGRALGTPVLRELALASQNLLLEGDIKRPVKLYRQLMTRGPILRDMMLPYRAELRNAVDLIDAQQIASLYGQKVPENEQSWEDQKNNGASIEQTLFIENIQNEGIRTLINDQEQAKVGANIVFQDFQSFTELYSTTADKIAVILPLTKEYILKEMYYGMIVGQFLQHGARYGAPVPQTRAFICFNNPILHIFQSQIPDLQKLNERLAHNKANLFPDIDAVLESFGLKIS